MQIHLWSKQRDQLFMDLLEVILQEKSLTRAFHPILEDQIKS